jgi:hypothetical protein
MPAWRKCILRCEGPTLSVHDVFRASSVCRMLADKAARLGRAYRSCLRWSRGEERRRGGKQLSATPQTSGHREERLQMLLDDVRGRARTWPRFIAPRECVSQRRLHGLYSRTNEAWVTMTEGRERAALHLCLRLADLASFVGVSNRAPCLPCKPCLHTLLRLQPDPHDSPRAYFERQAEPIACIERLIQLDRPITSCVGPLCQTGT